MIEGGRFHHVGVACTDLDREAERFGQLGYRREGDDFTDPEQRISGRFLVADGQPRLELLVDSGPGGPLGPWLEKGVKLYHFAYEVPDLGAALDRLTRDRARVVVPPVPAVAFGGREIAFAMQPGGFLVELIHTPS
ncbi:MAG: VOC family protein [Planctomycetota bacterium]